MSAEAMRESFEKWFTEADSPEMAARALERNGGGSYKLMAAHQAWMVWQAATANQEALINAALDAAAETCATVHDQRKVRGLTNGYNAIMQCAEAIRQITPQQVMERLK